MHFLFPWLVALAMLVGVRVWPSRSHDPAGSEPRSAVVVRT